MKSRSDEENFAKNANIINTKNRGILFCMAGMHSFFPYCSLSNDY